MISFSFAASEEVMIVSRVGKNLTRVGVGGTMLIWACDRETVTGGMKNKNLSLSCNPVPEEPVTGIWKEQFGGLCQKTRPRNRLRIAGRMGGMDIHLRI